MIFLAGQSKSTKMPIEGALEKMEVDYSSTVDEKLPELIKKAEGGSFDDALEELIGLEKLTRTASDAISTGRVLVAIVQICFHTKKWDKLNENLVALTKRKSQLKQAVTKMVQEAFTYVDQTPNMETKLKLIETLRTITAGKIYVEIERARLTRILAKIKEDEGNITEAADILQELQVETYGSMERREKTDFILEQIRLCLAKKDYIRTQIISKKISTKYFDEADTEDLKLRYYRLMIELGQHEKSYLAICKHYWAVYDTKSIKENAETRDEALKCVVLYATLSPFDNEQSDLVARIKQDKSLEKIPKHKELLTLFTTKELINYAATCKSYETELRNGPSDQGSSQIFSAKTEEGRSRWDDLKKRVVEHNIRVMAGYYVRIRLARMAALLNLSEKETEDFLADLVTKKMVSAKMDRLTGIVNFTTSKDPDTVLNEWSHNVNALMTLVNKTTHLISKEKMVHYLH